MYTPHQKKEIIRGYQELKEKRETKIYGNTVFTVRQFCKSWGMSTQTLYRILREYEVDF